jgi:hypothetical protein
MIPIEGIIIMVLIPIDKLIPIIVTAFIIRFQIMIVCIQITRINSIIPTITIIVVIIVIPTIMIIGIMILGIMILGIMIIGTIRIDIISPTILQLKANFNIKLVTLTKT